MRFPSFLFPSPLSAPVSPSRARSPKVCLLTTRPHRNVTAIFAILMRLRQAVLHPSLVVNRIKEKLSTKGIKRRAPDAPLGGHGEDGEADGELDERDILTLIERYMAGVEGLGLPEGGVAALGGGGKEGGAGTGKARAIEPAVGKEGEKAEWMAVDVDGEDEGEGGGDCPICAEVRFALSLLAPFRYNDRG